MNLSNTLTTKSGVRLMLASALIHRIEATGMIGEHCNPMVWGTDLDMCPMAHCLESPAGCDYVLDHYEVNDDLECCPRLCFAVDSYGNECSSTEVIGDQCNPKDWGTDINKCPFASCPDAPAGCEYAFDHFEVNMDWECCPSLCYSIDENGTACTFSSTQNGEGSRNLDEQCEPTGEESCPVAKCTATRAGCDYVFDHYVINGAGDCCASLCYAVDGDGNECTIDGPSNSENATKVGELCDQEPLGTSPEMCPMAGCAEAPAGCEYVFDHFVVNTDGDCCASPCYAVDGDGNACSIDDPSNSTNATKVGEQCDQETPEMCPMAAMARCGEAPVGCGYVFDHFVINAYGDCCASLCYAVDGDGNECSIDGPSNSENATKVGELCDQGQLGTSPEICPMAGCAEAPAGCEYVFDHFVVNTDGDCCASPCYAVDGDGNACSIDDPSNSTNATKVGEQCDQEQLGTSPDMCPMARCGQAPPGCQYVFDHFVINTAGDCCASLCYAVDGDGNECTDFTGTSGALVSGAAYSSANTLARQLAFSFGLLALFFIHN